jgi:tetratricopeptide (TPR) repeat protein
MFYQESADAAHFEEVILQSLRHILRHQDAERFLDWARRAIPDLLMLGETSLEPGEDTRLAILLARGIWNATPLPDRGFRTQPLEEPGPQDPCPCGSGETYGNCCAQVADAPELPADLIWGILIEELGERELRRALDEGAVPVHLLGLAGERWLSEGRPGRAVALLEPLFREPPPEPLDERFDGALNTLCDAYDQLDHWKKKRELLARMTRSPCRSLRSSAWQRLSTIHIDEGDFLEAQVAFTEAQREGPDDPGTALLEITLLAAQHEDERARRRAVFWRHKLKRAGYGDDEVMTFLERAAEDPQDALMASQSAILDPLLLLLREWVQAAAQRPLPVYGLEGLPRSAATGSASQLSLFEEGDAAGARTPESTQRIAKLRAPNSLRGVESHWRRVFTAAKPASTQLLPLPLEDVWEREDWVAFLARHPQAADSIDILDDLATALYIHPDSALPWIRRALLVPLLERAAAIVGQILTSDSGWTIPWPLEENRPALRLLFRLYQYQAEAGDDRAATETLRTLLRLNPGDNHGVRADLINHYLRVNENDQALALAERFPDDRLADLAFGEVLALYRLGRRAAAEAALTRALSRLPQIPAYLTRKRVRQPGAKTGGGGELQAWLYREAMRDVWEAEPGVLAWLKKHAG